MTTLWISATVLSQHEPYKHIKNGRGRNEKAGLWALQTQTKEHIQHCRHWNTVTKLTNGATSKRRYKLAFGAGWGWKYNLIIEIFPKPSQQAGHCPLSTRIQLDRESSADKEVPSPLRC